MTIQVSIKGKDLDSSDHVLDLDTPETKILNKLVLRNPARKDCAFDAV